VQQPDRIAVGQLPIEHDYPERRTFEQRLCLSDTRGQLHLESVREKDSPETHPYGEAVVDD
jgi:hypothetical protein